MVPVAGRFGGSGGRRKPVQAIEQRERLVRRRAALDSRRQQLPRANGVATLKRGRAGLQQLFTLALPLGDRTARPLDVGACTRVTAIQKQDARPNTDCQLVLSAEVVIEAREQQLFDARIAARLRSGAVVVVS